MTLAVDVPLEDDPPVLGDREGRVCGADAQGGGEDHDERDEQPSRAHWVAADPIQKPRCVSSALADQPCSQAGRSVLGTSLAIRLMTP